MTPPTDRQLDRLYAILHESERLSKLTARELIYECLGRSSADDPHVTELMNRVMPGWERQFTEEELEA